MSGKVLAEEPLSELHLLVRLVQLRSFCWRPSVSYLAEQSFISALQAWIDRQQSHSTVSSAKQTLIRLCINWMQFQAPGVLNSEATQE
jgi:hypothetical protein